jgi:curved DNA-binding protein
MNYYNILELEIGASKLEIKKKYRELAKKYHPDISGDGGDKFKEINEAYSVLYNNETPSNNTGQSRRQETRRQEARPFDIYHTINVTLKDTYFGMETKMRIGGKVFNIVVPRGIQSGTTINIKNGGERGGNLFIQVFVNDDDKKVKKVDSLDLEMTYNVSFIDFIKSSQIEIYMWDDYICKITIPPGLKTNDKIRIPNKGMKSDRFNISGDLYIKTSVVMPSYKDLPSHIQQTIDTLGEQLNEI